MKSSITEHPYGALSIPASGPEERRARACQDLARVAALDHEQLPLALAFLSGYYPRVFDAVLEAVEPCDGSGTEGREPFCVKCGASVGIFLAYGKEYRHYRGLLTTASKPQTVQDGSCPASRMAPGRYRHGGLA